MEDKELFRSAREVDEERLARMIDHRLGESPKQKSHKLKGKTADLWPFLVFGAMVLLMLLSVILFPGNPGYMELTKKNLAPDRAYIFGTDTLGRDVFGMILHGGRISLQVGFYATIISTSVALFTGSAAAFLPEFPGKIISRITDLFLSVPSILLMIFIQAMTGGNSLFSISLSIGLSSWMTLGKLVKIQMEKTRQEEYVFLAKYYGGGYFYLMKKHYLPEVIPVLFYVSFSGFGHAMVSETTLSFLGLGFPVGTVTWGSLLSLSGDALMTKSWWIILIPGIFLVSTVVSLVEMGDVLRKKNAMEKLL